MIEAWLLEFAKGIGRFFLHPLFYYLAGYCVLLGYFRVKRERRAFHIRVEDGFYDLRSLLPGGWLAGLLISVLTIAAGVVIPFGSIVLIAIVTLLLSLPIKTRLLSPAYILGVSFFGIILLSNLSVENKFITRLLDDMGNTSLASIAILLGSLLLAEGILILKKGHIGTSPDLLKSKRGLPVGAHISQRLWLAPVFLLMPGEALTTHYEWWPVFTVSGQAYSLILIPFGIGFYHKVKSMLPTQSIPVVGKRVILLSIFVTGLAVASIWLPVAAIIAACFALAGRELIYLKHYFMDESKPSIFSQRNQGLLVLGIIPQSPAEKMQIKIGETISKVNGIHVKTVQEFYSALQKNRALCKLDVLDINGEVRYVQRALYEGEHHELGILFVNEGKRWKHNAV
ncbi:PDZ domain-containing protein [Bacillus sp. HNG]|uniref:PDZ domain-containing protein n=1 Tax=Bacillus sp. HNG TaxID=2293325 RepID=UPI000E2E9DF8|nr:PDZ domain-containing protein [Bacillus sp. HNG]RFB14892.1 PDZ domain-containing protein [Bacillus sp. HNG]